MTPAERSRAALRAVALVLGLVALFLIVVGVGPNRRPSAVPSPTPGPAVLVEEGC